VGLFVFSNSIGVNKIKILVQAPVFDFTCARTRSFKVFAFSSLVSSLGILSPIFLIPAQTGDVELELQLGLGIGVGSILGFTLVHYRLLFNLVYHFQPDKNLYRLCLKFIYTVKLPYNN